MNKVQNFIEKTPKNKMRVIIVALSMLLGILLGVLIYLSAEIFGFSLNVDYWGMAAITFSVTFLTTSLLGGLSDKSEKIYWISYPDEYLIEHPLNFLTLSTISYICLGVQVLFALVVPDSFVLKEGLFISFFTLAIVTIVILSYSFTSVYFDRDKYLRREKTIFMQKMKADDADWIRDTLIELYGNTLYCIEERSTKNVAENLALLIPVYNEPNCRKQAKKIVKAIDDLNKIIAPEVMLRLDDILKDYKDIEEYHEMFKEDVTKLMISGDISYETWKECEFDLKQLYNAKIEQIKAETKLIDEMNNDIDIDKWDESKIDERKHDARKSFEFSNQLFKCFFENHDAERVFEVTEFMLGVNKYIGARPDEAFFDNELSSKSREAILNYLDVFMNNIQTAAKKHQDKVLKENFKYMLAVINNYDNLYVTPENPSVEDECGLCYAIKDNLKDTIINRFNELLIGIHSSAPEDFDYILMTALVEECTTEFYKYCFLHSSSIKLCNILVDSDSRKAERAVKNVISELISDFHQEENYNVDMHYSCSKNIYYYNKFLWFLKKLKPDMDSFVGKIAKHIVSTSHFVSEYKSLLQIPMEDDDGNDVYSEQVVLNALVKIYEVYGDDPDELEKYAELFKMDYYDNKYMFLNKCTEEEVEYFAIFIMDKMLEADADRQKILLRLIVNVILCSVCDITREDSNIRKLLLLVKSNEELKQEVEFICNESDELSEMFAEPAQSDIENAEYLTDEGRRMLSSIVPDYEKMIMKLRLLMMDEKEKDSKQGIE